MDFFNKLLNPLQGRHEKPKYQDLSKESQKVSARPPSALLLYSRDLAGEQIQKHMNLLNGCAWIRAQYTYPAFDDMTFIYKNKVFSVAIDIQDEKGNSYLPIEYISRQLYACEHNNLIPCKFPITVPNPEEPDFEKVKSKTNGWNLFNTKTNEEIFPEQLATTEKVKLSEWEMRNLAVKYALMYLNAKKYKVFSYQDILEADPQIWFEDKNGKKCWLLVRSALAPVKDVEKPPKLQEIIRRCFKNDGYFLGIIFTPQNEDEKDLNLYRFGQVKINIADLEKIHSVM